MNKIILALVTFSLSTTTFAMGSVQPAIQAEAAAEKVIPQTELIPVRVAANAFTKASLPGNSTDAERKAAASFVANGNKALAAAVTARLALDRAGFERNAAIVFANRDKACAVLSGC